MANAAHVDPNDGGRCHAVWLRTKFLEAEPKNWYMLFPDVGLAIQLCHGACLSWDGREARHCTSVAQKTTEQDVLFSYFFGLNTPVERGRIRIDDFEQAAKERDLCPTYNYPAFIPDMLVWVKVTKGEHIRIAKAKVVCIRGEMLLLDMGSATDARPKSFMVDDPNIVIGGKFQYE